MRPHADGEAPCLHGPTEFWKLMNLAAEVVMAGSWVRGVLTCELIVLRTKGISLLILELLALWVCQPPLPESQAERQKQPKDSGVFLLCLETEGVCFVSYLCF